MFDILQQLLSLKLHPVELRLKGCFMIYELDKFGATLLCRTHYRFPKISISAVNHAANGANYRPSFAHSELCCLDNL